MLCIRFANLSNDNLLLCVCLSVWFFCLFFSPRFLWGLVFSSNLCTIILPWEKHCYKLLPTRITNSPDIFQQKMNDLFHGFKFIPEYIYELLILEKGGWKDHVQKLKLTRNRPKEKGIKYNTEKSFFRQTEMKYLGFWITRDGVKPINKKDRSNN